MPKGTRSTFFLEIMWNRIFCSNLGPIILYVFLPRGKHLSWSKLFLCGISRPLNPKSGTKAELKFILTSHCEAVYCNVHWEGCCVLGGLFPSGGAHMIIILLPLVLRGELITCMHLVNILGVRESPNSRTLQWNVCPRDANL